MSHTMSRNHDSTGFFSRLSFFWIFRSKWVKRNRKSIGQEDRAVQVAQEMVTNVTS